MKRFNSRKNQKILYIQLQLLVTLKKRKLKYFHKNFGLKFTKNKKLFFKNQILQQYLFNDNVTR